MPRILLIILFSVCVSVGGLACVYKWVPLAWLTPNQELVGNYLQTVGTIYAVLLAFVVFVVWNQHNEARGLVHREANDLLDMHRLLGQLPGGAACCVAVEEYAQAILAREWEDMRDGNPAGSAWQHLETVWKAVAAFEPTTARHEAFLGEMLTCFNDLSDARADRLRSAQTRIPPILWGLLLSGASVTVFSMYLFAVRDFGTHAIMTGALAGAVSHVLYVIWDLDNCFSGYWRVEKEPFVQVLQRMRAHAA